MKEDRRYERWGERNGRCFFISKTAFLEHTISAARREGGGPDLYCYILDTQNGLFVNPARDGRGGIVRETVGVRW